MPNFTFYGGRKQAKTTFFFSFKTWVWFLRNQLQGNSPTFDIFRELEQAWESLKKRQVILKVTFSLPSPSSMLKLPIIESTSGSWKLFGEINVILERKQVCKLTARALKGLKVCLQWKVHLAYTATIYDIRTWVNWRNNVDRLCSTSFFLSPQCWPRTWTIPPKNHYKTTSEKRMTSIWVVWPKLSVTEMLRNK